MPRIIFISTLTLWSMGKGHGGPAFYRTITEYINKGWDVYLITDEISNKDFPYLDSKHLIYVSASKRLKKCCQIKKLGLIFRYIEHGVKTKLYIEAAEQILTESNEKTVLYAYEVAGVAACKYLSQKYRLPFVSRFQGTILSQYRGTLGDKIRWYPHYQALSTKSDLVIMTDDGTQGDQVLQSLHNSSNMLFLRNGLDLLEENAYKGLTEDEKKYFRHNLGKGVLDEDCMFLTVSRLVSWKRVERAIDGFALFIKSGIPGKLIIVGDGDSREKLEKYAQFKGIGESVYFVGSVPHEKVYDYMTCCNVFLSLYDLSNVGNPLLEAMALGKSIITLDVGDTNKVIINEKNGILLKKEELLNLGQVMEKLASDPAYRSQLENGAKEYAREHLASWTERMAVEYGAISALLNLEN
ncbi:MAG: glycosyltransferase family 4 protein [Agathobacter sp.]